MVEIISILILGLLVLAQAVERYFFAKHMTEQLENCVKAVMSRNINDYLTATNESKKDKEFVQEDEVDLETLPDEEYLKAIKEGTD